MARALPRISNSAPPNTDEPVSPTTPPIVKRDIEKCITIDPQHLLVAPDTENNLIAHVVIIGSEQTPYEGGFFYFIVTFPPKYPLSPPTAKLMNTERNSIVFNPKFYPNGTICMNTLAWSPVMTLHDFVLFIQSLMNGDPIHHVSVARRNNQDITSGDYNKYIRHETIRVAVIRFMDDGNTDTERMPNSLRNSVKTIFREKIEFYRKTIEENQYLNNRQMLDPFNANVESTNQKYVYSLLKTKMDELIEKYKPDPELKAAGGSDHSSDSYSNS